jgi:uncharacterized membrane protein
MSERVASGGRLTERRLRIASAGCCVIGIGIAGYLTYVHYAGIKVLCLASGGCETVQSSRYAQLDGIPVALLGLVGYVAILISLADRGDTGRIVGAVLALSGLGFSAYRELYTIHAICQWCVGSALLMSALAALTITRLLQTDVNASSTDPPSDDMARLP